jgi:hypothetical protein
METVLKKPCLILPVLLSNVDNTKLYKNAIYQSVLTYAINVSFDSGGVSAA